MDKGSNLHSDENIWKVVRASRASVIVDADDYFNAARRAMCQARQRIWLIGWDFDARIPVGTPEDDGGPPLLGGFIYWLARNRPDIEINILRWATGAMKTLFQPTTLRYTMQWKLHPRITLRLDSHHPFGSSHHQKIVVIDGSLAFCGGIDMTAGRWDRHPHRDDEPLRVLPGGKPCKPWHDATFALEGPAATALEELAAFRWRQAGGTLRELSDDRHPIWPEGLKVQFRDVDVAIARSIPEMEDQEAVREIEKLFLDMIRTAKRHIYIESQYFASRAVAVAIAERLAEPDCPEIMIVQAESAEGWLEPIAMDSARAKLMRQLSEVDTQGRLRLYHPMTRGGTGVYVHAKIMICDDRLLRVGSANLNNRSMRLDTECDIMLDAEAQEDSAKRSAVEEEIRTLRNELLAEHLDIDLASVDATLTETGSLFALVDRHDPQGHRLQPYKFPENGAVEDFLAENEILDPEGPDAMFEPMASRGLRRGIRKRWRRRRQAIRNRFGRS